MSNGGQGGCFVLCSERLTALCELGKCLIVTNMSLKTFDRDEEFEYRRGL